MAHDFPYTPVLQITTLNNCITARFPHPYNFRGEFHPFWEMVYAVDGTFQVAGNEKVYTMRKGDVIFHKPMEFHRLWSVDGQDVQAYIIGFCAEGPLLHRLEGGAFVLTEEQQHRLHDLMTFAAKEFSRKEHKGMQDHLWIMEKSDQDQGVQIQTFVELLQLFLLSLAERTAPMAIKELWDSEDSRIYRHTVRLLTEHVNSWITVEEISNRLHYSQSRLKRTFAKFSDIGIHKYLLKLKAAEAIHLLRRGCSCSEVSTALGFPNQNYFSTVFKRETGFPPSHYSSLQ